jgi:hypothetical protein
VGLPRAALSQLGLADEAALGARIEARRTGDLRVRREVGGIGKWVDVAHYLLGVEVGDGAAELQRAGIAGELLPLRVRMQITPSGTAKISEVLESLLGASELPARVVRAALLWNSAGERGTPLDIDAARRARATLAAAPVADTITQAGASEA